MTAIFKILLLLHILSWVGALVLIDPIGSKIRKGASHAVAGALLTGIAMVGLAEMRDFDVNHVKIGIKLLIALVATVALFLEAKKGEDSKQAGPLFGLVTANILIAILW